MDGDAALAWSDDGRPRSTVYDDIYFAPEGLAESRTVFLQGCGLPEAWTGRRRFTVAELGFGTGLNILALLQLWRDARPAEARLHVFSLEAHPLTSGDASRALARFPELGDLAAPLLARWPGGARGFERYAWPELGATLDVARAEAAEALEAWSGAADAWFLDGFAPSRNPDMWRPEVLDLVTARSAPDARLATFTVAGAVRRGLAERGWTLTRAEGHGGKRERLEARRPGRATTNPEPARVTVIGAGIAGASLVRAFSALGAACTVVDSAPERAASRNPAAFVSPRLDAGGGPAARLYAQAFARAVQLYSAETPGAVIARGGLHLGGKEKDLERFRKAAASDLFAPGDLTELDAASAQDRLGAPAGLALLMRDALTLEPQVVLETWLSRAQPPSPEADPTDGILCVAAGAGSLMWLPPGFLEPVRGQANWTRKVDLPGAAASWGGYAVPLRGGGFLFGATHDRGSDDDGTRAEDDLANLAALAERLPDSAEGARSAPLGARAAVRAAAPDRLPLAGAVPGRTGVFILSGLGGRGFTTAPVLAEHVAALALGAPSPLPRDLAAAVDPARFLARFARRKS
jgi:tRNA 5-methylaminomethyl-2-thiouridine biosynthesis bifunctional protein